MTALFSLLFLAAAVDNNGDAGTTVLGLAGVPCAVGLIAGAVAVLRRRPGPLLLGTAVLLALILVLVLASGLTPYDSPDGHALITFVFLAVPLPVVTACLAARREIAEWIAAHPYV